MFRPRYKKCAAALLVTALVFIAAPETQVRAVSDTIYVNSETGHDEGTGTSAADPFKTWTRGYSQTPDGGTMILDGTFTWTDAAETGDNAPLGFVIDKSITIQGSDAGSAIIQASAEQGLNDSRVLTINTSGAVTLRNLVIRNGTLTGTSGGSPNGGGLLITAGAVTLNDCYLYSNSADQGGAIALGNAAALQISNSTLAANAAQNGRGGAISAQNAAQMILTNVTITGNTASGNGGGLALACSGSTFITNCTIARNTSAAAGGGLDVTMGGSAQLQIKNTLLTNNTASVAAAGDGDFTSGSIIDNGYNVFGSYRLNGMTFSLHATSMLAGGNALHLAGSLADNGGRTPTLALLAGSPAIDMGNSAPNGAIAVPTTDQRGCARQNLPDVGAYEFVPPVGQEPTATSTQAAVTPIPTASAAPGPAPDLTTSSSSAAPSTRPSSATQPSATTSASASSQPPAPTSAGTTIPTTTGTAALPTTGTDVPDSTSAGATASVPAPSGAAASDPPANSDPGRDPEIWLWLAAGGLVAVLTAGLLIFMTQKRKN